MVQHIPLILTGRLYNLQLSDYLYTPILSLCFFLLRRVMSFAPELSLSIYILLFRSDLLFTMQYLNCLHVSLNVI